MELRRPKWIREWPPEWVKGIRLPGPWTAEISLANKCLLLFGGAVVLIMVVALSVPWLRMNSLVDGGGWDVVRYAIERGASDEAGALPVRRLSVPEAEARDERFVTSALRAFQRREGRAEYRRAAWDGGTRVYRLARAERDAEGALTGLVVVEARLTSGAVRYVVNLVYMVSAGSLVLGLATLVFYLVTHNLILSPVRSLRNTAEQVRQGRLDTRSDIRTGDEFQELAETFNLMLTDMAGSHQQLRSINKALDIKVAELAKANTALHESARLKGEFLASVSHELRTPLNSIIGFAELLLEIAQTERDAGDDSTRLAKRIRYLEHITGAGRRLLEMIEALLEMAKLEAGKVELTPGVVDLGETCDALVGLIYPLAEKRGVDVVLEVEEDVPLIETDVKKLQQIVFNFLSNAVKFIEPEERTGRRGRVTLRAERLPPVGDEEDERVRVSVIDTGPGIAEADRQRIFDKFEQLDAGLLKQSEGSGLGLAICRELASILQGEIQLDSEVGRGSMFSVILPLRLDPGRTEEIRLESAFRASLAGRSESGGEQA